MGEALVAQVVVGFVVGLVGFEVSLALVLFVDGIFLPGHGGWCGGVLRGMGAAVAGHERVHVTIIIVISEDVKRIVFVGLPLMYPWQLSYDSRCCDIIE